MTELAGVRMDQLASIAATMEDVSPHLNITWQTYPTDGLGEEQEAVFRTEEGTWFALRYLHDSPRNDLLTLCVELNDTGRHIDSALASLSLTSASLRWLAPGIELPGHSLFREDDNGARFHVGDFPCRADAEAKVAALTFGSHKQAYFIEPTAKPVVRLAFDPDARQPPTVLPA